MTNNIPLGLRFSLLHRSFKKQMDRMLAEMDLTGVQFGVMGCLIRREREGLEETSQKDLEEAPGAYKDIDEVMANQKDLVKIVTELTPIAVVKGL